MALGCSVAMLKSTPFPDGNPDRTEERSNFGGSGGDLSLQKPDLGLSKNRVYSQL